ncbi:MAG: cation:proton antiporter [Phycisphaeraceae bacterium]
MQTHFAWMVLILGLAFLAASVLPPLLRRLPLSMPIVYVGVGMLLPVLWDDSPRADPLLQSVLTERLAELAVIISLMGAGLKLERPIGLKRWALTWRLLGVTMPLCIVALILGGWYLMGLTLAGAVMLGAVMAPTDPVLAASVQVGPPGKKDTSDTRFALTSEAGLNDGLAFPFVNLAILLAGAGLTAGSLTRWVAVDVVWKIAAGITVGWLSGRVLAWLIFRFTRPGDIIDGFVALAITLVTYGATELVHGYGFIAVFVAALVFRAQERNHELHRTLHAFVDQAERLLMAGLLIFFGASITHGLFAALTWQGVVVGLVFLLVVRPGAGLVALIGTRLGWAERFAIGGLGIRGIGTFYYMAHGLNQTSLLDADMRALWATAGLIVLVSVVLHGTTAEFAMRYVHGREAGGLKGS